MKLLQVNASGPLSGRIKIPGSKNSTLGLLAACCLSGDKVRLENVPNIADINVVCEIGNEIGMNIAREDRCLTVDARGIMAPEIDPNKSSFFRTAYYFVGALLSKYKKVSVGYPGGDNIGPRPIDQHIKGLRALGASVTFHDTYYVVEADRLTGADIYFDLITSGATINLMLAAVLANGRTILHNAARDPEVVDVAVFLNKIGAKVSGAGTETIRIDGVTGLGGCTHTVIPDRLIASAYMMLAGITDGCIVIEDAIHEHLDACIEKLTEIGLDISTRDSSITVSGTGSLRATRIRTGMYPVFATDYQQPVTALLLKANGRSTISDRIYPYRFNHCEQLKRMGADISIRSGVARINSIKPLKGTLVYARDIRAGICLIMAGLIAEGTTYISGVEHIDRGYENIAKDLTSLGARIKLADDSYQDSSGLHIQPTAKSHI